MGQAGSIPDDSNEAGAGQTITCTSAAADPGGGDEDQQRPPIPDQSTKISIPLPHRKSVHPSRRANLVGDVPRAPPSATANPTNARHSFVRDTNTAARTPDTVPRQERRPRGDMWRPSHDPSSISPASRRNRSPLLHRQSSFGSPGSPQNRRHSALDRNSLPGDTVETVDHKGVKNVPTGPRGIVRTLQYARRQPHIFIAADWLPPVLDTARHLKGYLKEHRPDDILLDDTGWALVFADTYLGRERLDLCYKNFHKQLFFNMYELVMQRFDNGWTQGDQDDEEAMRRASGDQASRAAEPATVTSDLSEARQHVVANGAAKPTAPHGRLQPRLDGAQPLQNDELTAIAGHARPPTEELATTISKTNFQAKLGSVDRDETSSIISATTRSDGTQSKTPKCHVCKQDAARRAGGLVKCSSCTRRYHQHCGSHKVPTSDSVSLATSWSCARCIRKGLGTPDEHTRSSGEAPSKIAKPGKPTATKTPSEAPAHDGADIRTRDNATQNSVNDVTPTAATAPVPTSIGTPIALSTNTSVRKAPLPDLDPDALVAQSFAENATTPVVPPKKGKLQLTRTKLKAATARQPESATNASANGEHQVAQQSVRNMPPPLKAQQGPPTNATAAGLRELARNKIAKDKLQANIAKMNAQLKDQGLLKTPDTDGTSTSLGRAVQTTDKAGTVRHVRIQEQPSSTREQAERSALHSAMPFVLLKPMSQAMVEKPAVNTVKGSATSTAPEPTTSVEGHAARANTPAANAKDVAEPAVASASPQTTQDRATTSAPSSRAGSVQSISRQGVSRVSRGGRHGSGIRRCTECNTAFSGLLAVCKKCREKKAAPEVLGSAGSKELEDATARTQAQFSERHEERVTKAQSVSRDDVGWRKKVVNGTAFKRKDDHSGLVADDSMLPTPQLELSRKPQMATPSTEGEVANRKPSQLSEGQTSKPTKGAKLLHRSTGVESTQDDMEDDLDYATPPQATKATGTGSAGRNMMVCESCRKAHRRCFHGVLNASSQPEEVIQDEYPDQQPQRVSSRKDRASLGGDRSPSIMDVDESESDEPKSIRRARKPVSPSDDWAPKKMQKMRALLGVGNAKVMVKGSRMMLIGMALSSTADHRLQTSGVVHWVSENIPQLFRRRVGEWEKSLAAQMTQGKFNPANGTGYWRMIDWQAGDGGIGYGAWYELLPGKEKNMWHWDAALKEPVKPDEPVKPGVKPAHLKSDVDEKKAREVSDGMPRMSAPSMGARIDDITSLSKRHLLTQAQPRIPATGRFGGVPRARMVPRRHSGLDSASEPDEGMNTDDDLPLANGQYHVRSGIVGKGDGRKSTGSGRTGNASASSDDEPIVRKRKKPGRLANAAQLTSDDEPLAKKIKQKSKHAAGNDISSSEDTSLADSARKPRTARGQSRSFLDGLGAPSAVVAPTEAAIKDEKPHVATAPYQQYTLPTTGGLSLAQLIKHETQNIDYSATSLFDEWPEEHPDFPSAADTKQTKQAEISKRPTRKEMFAQPASRSRLQQAKPARQESPMKYISPEKRSRAFVDARPDDPYEWEEVSFDPTCKKFDTLDDFFDMPAEQMPVMWEGQLAYRDGTKLGTGRLPKPKAIFPVGHGA